jgi:hypothetical protein
MKTKLAILAMMGVLAIAPLTFARGGGGFGAVTAEVTDSRAVDHMAFTAAEAMGLTAEAVGSMAEAVGTPVEPIGTTADTAETTADTMVTTADNTDTIGTTGMDTTAAAGGFHGSSVLDGVIRGTGIGTTGIPTTAPITIGTMAIHMGVTTVAITAAGIMEMAMPTVQG